MTSADRNLRQYFFRHMIVEHGNQWRKVKQSPMILTWREARYYWRAAKTLALKTRQALA